MSPLPLGNRDLMRAINRAAILTTIKSNGLIDRAQVARLTGLSPATVTGITSELIEEGLVFEKQPGDSRGGRPPILLAINPRGGFVVGIKLMEDHALGALTDLESTVIAKDSRPLKNKNSSEAIAVLSALVQSLVAQANIDRRRLLGVGVGLAGVVDSEHGILRESPFFGWRDLPLRDLLQNLVQTPVYLDNDVNTLTLAEQWFGAGQGVDHFLVVTVGRGIGLGVVANGRFYRGTGGGAGELGHTLIDPQGPLCDCGKHGCLETYAGYPGLLRSAHQAYLSGEVDQDVTTIEQLIRLAGAGQPAMMELLAQAGGLLGRAMSSLVNILNPALIIIGGEGVQLGAPFFEPLQNALRQYSMPNLFQDVRIQIEPWGDDVWARGAASLVLRQLFESPVHKDTN
ncbi:MAG TPA: ROK family transcriptional regulator [Bellilinea sp.]|nr:ROK family transcriptional regulator [Bellilinea sp.]